MSDSSSGAEAIPKLTGAEAPLNQSLKIFPARALGWDAVVSAEPPLDGMKFASDLVGEWKDVLEVCCCSVDAARLTNGLQFSKKVPVKDR